MSPESLAFCFPHAPAACQADVCPSLGGARGNAASFPWLVTRCQRARPSLMWLPVRIWTDICNALCCWRGGRLVQAPREATSVVSAGPRTLDCFS